MKNKDVVRRIETTNEIAVKIKKEIAETLRICNEERRFGEFKFMRHIEGKMSKGKQQVMSK